MRTHRHPVSFAFAAAALCAAALVPPAHATTQTVEIRAARLSSADWQAVRGSYALADGNHVDVRRRGGALRAEFADGRVAMLQPVSAKRFESADGRWQLDFDAAANGLVDTVRVTMPAR